MAQVEKWKNAG